jgi:hypothetical protein
MHTTSLEEGGRALVLRPHKQNYLLEFVKIPLGEAVNLWF